MNIQIMMMNFFTYIEESSIEIYNEFSFQHELGIYLRKNLPTNYKVQFERNVNCFSKITTTIKKEIDISICNTIDETERYAIELKYPLNGQYPEQMYSFIKDIKFMEQLKELGFKNTYVVVLVKDKPFYKGVNNVGIYEYFRANKSIYGRIFKPTGSQKNIEYIDLKGTYNIDWIDTIKNQKYYCVSL